VVKSNSNFSSHPISSLFVGNGGISLDARGQLSATQPISGEGVTIGGLSLDAGRQPSASQPMGGDGHRRAVSILEENGGETRGGRDTVGVGSVGGQSDVVGVPIPERPQQRVSRGSVGSGTSPSEVSLATMVMNRANANAATESRREASLGQMRCLSALAEWEALGQLCAQEWELSAGVGAAGAGGVGAGGDAIMRGRMAPLATQAAWHLNDWSRMEVYSDAVAAAGIGGGGGGRSGAGRAGKP
jgi:hypothetical protein